MCPLCKASVTVSSELLPAQKALPAALKGQPPAPVCAVGFLSCRVQHPAGHSHRAGRVQQHLPLGKRDRVPEQPSGENGHRPKTDPGMRP